MLRKNPYTEKGVEIVDWQNCGHNTILLIYICYGDVDNVMFSWIFNWTSFYCLLSLPLSSLLSFLYTLFLYTPIKAGLTSVSVPESVIHYTPCPCLALWAIYVLLEWTLWTVGKHDSSVIVINIDCRSILRLGCECRGNVRLKGQHVFGVTKRVPTK